MPKKNTAPLGKRKLREAIEDAWYDAPSASAGFGRIEVIIEQQIEAVLTEAEKAIRQAVGEEMLELIGIDITDMSGACNELSHKFMACSTCRENMLRAELRQKIKEWQGGSDE